MELPRPANWQEFEKMVRDAMAQRWQSTGLTMNGRLGQTKLGIDIRGTDDLGRVVGIQCKKSLGPLLFSTVVKEVDNAKSSNGKLATLYIATTAAHDAVLLENVRLLSEQQVLKGRFGVGILFWDEIVAGLALNLAVFSTHYPRQLPTRSIGLDRDRKLAALELGFYCAQLFAIVDVVAEEGEDGIDFDIDHASTLIRIVERRAFQLLIPTDANLVSEAVSAIGRNLPSALSTGDWTNLKVYVQRVFKWVNAASTLLPFDNANALKLGASLGRAFSRKDLASKLFKAQIQEQALVVLGPYSHSRAVTAFLAISAVREMRRWAMKAFALIDREIRYGS
jgi:hypothetical protein